MRFFVGTYSYPGSPGIGVCKMDTHGLRLISSFEGLKNPTWVTWHPQHDRLYAHGKNAQDEQVVASLRLEGDQLRLVSQAITNGNSSCHLTVSPEADYLLASHYHEGRISLYPLLQGEVGSQLLLVQQTGSGPVEDRQQSAHAHQSVFRPDSKELFVCDLGADKIFIYQLDGRLKPSGEITVPAGSGPRHLVFDGPDKFYLCAELSSEAMYYSLDDRGQWVLRQRLSTLPEAVPSNTCAAIRLREGQLSISNRGHNSIALFDLDQRGLMTSVGHISSRGQNPRDFVRLKDGFLAANQDGGGLQWMDASGQPIASLDLPGTVCIAGTEGF